jgi:hypothetical protein
MISNGSEIKPGPVIAIDGRFVADDKGTLAGGPYEAWLAERWAKASS